MSLQRNGLHRRGVSPARALPRVEELEPRRAPVNDLFVVPGAVGAATTLRFDYCSRDAALPSEMGVIRVDDARGTVNGLAPGSSGYIAAALARAQVLFAPGASPGARQNFSFTGGGLLAVYLVPGGTTAQVR